jgi:hypothetical protein
MEVNLIYANFFYETLMKSEKFNNTIVIEFPQTSFNKGIVNAIFISIIINSGLAWLVSPWLERALINPLGLPANIDIILVIVFFMVTLIPILGIVLWHFFHTQMVLLMGKLKPSSVETDNLLIIQQTVLDEIRTTSPYLSLMYQQLEAALNDTEVSVLALIKHSDEISNIARKHSEQIDEAIRDQATELQAEIAFKHGDTSNKSSSEFKNVIPDSALNKSSKLHDILFALQKSNAEVINKLSETFSFLQFQDLLRQRVEQTLSSIQELDEHLKEMVVRTEDDTWDGNIILSLKQRIENHLDQYVMSSQHEIHSALTGSKPPSDNDRPKIELF